MKSPLSQTFPKSEEEFLAKLRELIAEYGSEGGGFAAEIGMMLRGEGVSEAAKDRYSKGAYLMRDVAVLAFNYASEIAGASGFQASIAALEAYGSIVGIEHFGVIDLDNLLYPQYDLRTELENWIAEAAPRVRERATELLAEKNEMVHPDVKRHWQYLADGGKP